MDRILVLLATYNGEKFLREQLDSIFSQKNVDVTVLVRDDGSSDKTKKILDEYKENKALSWYAGEHLSIQKGYFDLMKKAATTDYEFFAFSDQDDVWDADKLTLGISEIRDQKQAALYYCGQKLVDEQLRPIADHELNEKRSLQTRFVLSDFAGCTGVFNKRLLDEVVLFEPEYMLMHDTWILKVCLCLGGYVKVDTKPRVKYRQHGGNTIGLGRNLPSYLKQVKQYIFEYQVERQMHELAKGYGNRMVSPYEDMCKWMCKYKSNKTYKRNLLNKKYVDFCSKGLNLTYRLKVLINKL